MGIGVTGIDCSAKDGMKSGKWRKYFSVRHLNTSYGRAVCGRSRWSVNSEKQFENARHELAESTENACVQSSHSSSATFCTWFVVDANGGRLGISALGAAGIG